jgi:hypothetical protein
VKKTCLLVVLAMTASLSACPVIDATAGFVTCGPDGWDTTRYPDGSYAFPASGQCDVDNFGTDECSEGFEWCWYQGDGARVCDVHGEASSFVYKCVDADAANAGPCANFADALSTPPSGDIVVQYGRLTLAPRDAEAERPACHPASFVVGGTQGPKTIEALRGTVHVVTNLEDAYVVDPATILIDNVVQADPDNTTYYPTHVYRAQICIPLPAAADSSITAVMIQVVTSAAASNTTCLLQE